MPTCPICNEDCYNKSIKEHGKCSYCRKGTKRSFSKKTRHLTWKRYIGNELIGNCFCCCQKIEYRNFHCSHVVPLCENGSNDIENLRICCAHCNLSCGKQNLLSFKAKTFPQIQVIQTPTNQAPANFLTVNDLIDFENVVDFSRLRLSFPPEQKFMYRSFLNPYFNGYVLDEYVYQDLNDIPLFGSGFVRTSCHVMFVYTETGRLMILTALYSSRHEHNQIKYAIENMHDASNANVSLPDHIIWEKVKHIGCSYLLNDIDPFSRLVWRTQYASFVESNLGKNEKFEYFVMKCIGRLFDNQIPVSQKEEKRKIVEEVLKTPNSSLEERLDMVNKTLEDGINWYQFQSKLENSETGSLTCSYSLSTKKYLLYA